MTSLALALSASARWRSACSSSGSSRTGLRWPRRLPKRPQQRHLECVGSFVAAGAPTHVHVLGHRGAGVAELVGVQPRR